MIVTVNRIKKGENETTSEFYVDGRLCAVSLEPKTGNNKQNEAIPEGEYILKKRYSPAFSPESGHDMIWVTGVTNREYILLHWGNIFKHTRGCLLIGERFGKLNGLTAVLNSRKTYDKIYPIISNAIDKEEVVKIKYINGYEKKSEQHEPIG